VVVVGVWGDGVGRGCVDESGWDGGGSGGWRGGSEGGRWERC